MKKTRYMNTVAGFLESDQVRRVEREGEHFYAVVDVVRALSQSEQPDEYWDDLKKREPTLAGVVEPMEVGGEMLEMAGEEGVFRVIQSIPSARAENIKRWLAESGRRRLEEAENPELAILRTARLYQQKGHSRQWVDKRLRGISARHELTSEWRKRGLTESDQYRALTNNLMQAAFGMDVNAYRRFKNLARPSKNLRDAMTDLELVLTMLGETTAAALHRDRGSQSFESLESDVKDAGKITAYTRREIEERSGKPVIREGRYGVPTGIYPGREKAQEKDVERARKTYPGEKADGSGDEQVLKEEAKQPAPGQDAGDLEMPR